MGITSIIGISEIIQNQYLRALIVFFVLLVVLRLLLTIAQRILIKLTSKTKTNLDDLVIEKSSKPLTLLAFLFSATISINEVTLSEAVQPVINKILYSAIAAVVGYIAFIVLDIVLIRVWKKITEKTETDIDDSLISLGHSALKGAFIIVIILYILNIWGVEIGPFLAGLGIAGLAVALALQPTLSNIFSGIALITDQTFRVGDVIKLESGELGTVHKIGLRATRMRTFDNEIIIVPNSTLANSRIQNFFLPDKSIRINVEFGVEYGTDPEYIKKITIEEIEKIEFLKKDEDINVLFLTMGDSALNFKVMFWVDDIAKKWPAHQEAITRIYRRLYEEGIGIPFPQRTVWTRDEGKVNSIKPSDSKFNKHNTKLYSDFGREYKEKKQEEKPKENKVEKKRFSVKRLFSKKK